MTQIDLSPLTGNGQVRNLSGHERGVAARKEFRVAELDEVGESVRVIVPSDLYGLSPSFFQGMFAESVRKFKSREAFLEHYSFDAPDIVVEQIENGIDLSLMKRTSIFSRSE